MANDLTRLGATFPRALVTGGSRGIGYAVAERLTRGGTATHLVARDPERLEQAVAALRRDASVEVTGTACDLRASDAGAQLSALLARAGPPGLVVCAAATMRPGRLEETAPETYAEVFDANVLSVVRTLQSVLPHLRRTRGERRIVLVGSGAAILGVYGMGPYGASKFALRGLAEMLRAELRAEGTGVSICYPPNTATDMREETQREAPAETEAITTKARTFTAGAVADALLAGVLKRRFEITPGYEMTLLNRLHSLFKPIIFRAWDAYAARGGRPETVN